MTAVSLLSTPPRPCTNQNYNSSSQHNSNVFLQSSGRSTSVETLSGMYICGAFGLIKFKKFILTKCILTNSFSYLTDKIGLILKTHRTYSRTNFRKS